MSYTLLIDLKQETVNCILVETNDTHICMQREVFLSPQ